MNRVKFCESLHTVAFSFLACEHAWNHQNDDATCFTNAEVSTACCVNLRSLFLRTVHNYYEGFIFSVARRDDSISSDACGDHIYVCRRLSFCEIFIHLARQYRFACLVEYPLRRDCPLGVDITNQMRVRGESCILVAAGGW